MSFLPPFVGCLLKKGLQKGGGSQVPKDTTGYSPVALHRYLLKTDATLVHVCVIEVVCTSALIILKAIVMKDLLMS